MLLDPFEEDLHLPTALVDLRYGKCWQRKVVGEEDEAQLFLGIEVVNAPQGRGITPRTLGSGEANGLIGTQSRGMIDPAPRTATVARVLLGARNEERQRLGPPASGLAAEVITANAACLPEISRSHSLPLFDYVLTSPPYWDMLHARGAQTQKKRRDSDHLDVFYSDDPQDLGNCHDYETFLSRLVAIYTGLKPLLRPRAYLTIIVKNIKKGGQVYPLAWDLGRELGKIYTLKDEKLWLQDNQRLAPYGLGSAWVSNTFHHYCLQFRNEETS